MFCDVLGGEFEALKNSLEADLTDLYGPVLTGSDIEKILRYHSTDAYRQAVTRKTVPVPIFEMENRRGKFALVKDVADYLARQRYNSITE